MTNLAASVEIIKAVAWPIAVLVSVIVFRREIAQLIPRLEQLGPSGVKIGPRVQTPVELSRLEIEGAAPSSPPGAEVVLPSPSDPVKLFEQSIRRNLTSTAPQNSASREKILVRSLAETQTELAFERIYNMIYGSQIRLLRSLNASGQLQPEDAVRIFNEARAAYPTFHSNRSYEMWRDFMAQSGLVQFDAVTGVVTPTPACPEFLAYIAKRHLPDEKAG